MALEQAVDQIHQKQTEKKHQRIDFPFGALFITYSVQKNLFPTEQLSILILNFKMIFNLSTGPWIQGWSCQISVLDIRLMMVPI